MAKVMNRLLEAMNAHDVDAFVACLNPDYRSEQPAHPGRAFDGAEKVRENWTNVFAGVNDFHAELLVSATTDDGRTRLRERIRGKHLVPSDQRKAPNRPRNSPQAISSAQSVKSARRRESQVR